MTVNLSSYDIRPGASQELADHNTPRFLQLLDNVLTENRDDIAVDGNVYSFNNIAASHRGYSSSLILNGIPGKTTFVTYGQGSPSATELEGTHFEFGGAGCPLYHSVIQGIWFLVARPSLGTMLRLGPRNNAIELERVRILDGGNGAGALVALEARTGFYAHNCKFETRRDPENLRPRGLMPTNLLISNQQAVGGIRVINCGFDNCVGWGFIVHTQNQALLDDMTFSMCSLKDGLIGWRSGFATGSVANVTFDPTCRIDGVEYGIYLEPYWPSGGDPTLRKTGYGNITLAKTWIAASKAGIVLSTANGGSVGGFDISGYITDSTEGAVQILGAVRGVSIDGLRASSQAAASHTAGLLFGGWGTSFPSHIKIRGGEAQALPGSLGAIYVPPQMTDFDIQDVSTYGQPPAVQGELSPSRAYTPGAHFVL